MNRDDVKRAADALGRLEALERALASLDRVPHGAMPVSFFDAGDSDDHQNDHGIKVYYPRSSYIEILRGLVIDEQRVLGDLGVALYVGVAL